MCAIGEKMTPATPVRVKRGKKATVMISTEKSMGGPISAAAERTRSRTAPRPAPPRWRYTFSIMITVESTMMPKSTAPSEMRFAGVPVAIIPQNAASRASGMFTAASTAARAWPRNTQRTSVTSTMPTSRFSITVRVVRWTSFSRS